jgi:isoleucyl-tRNA synthetase
LREALVVSELELHERDASGESSEPVRLEISHAAGAKCKRCWKYRELGVDPAHPEICAECAAVVRAL